MPMKSSSGGGGKDVRAGGAFVEIFGRDNLTKMLAKMKAHVLAFSKFLNDVAKTTLKAGAAMALPLTVLFGQGTSRAAEIDKLAAAWNTSTEQMSRFAYAAEVAGVALEEVIANQAKYADLIDKAPVIDAATGRAATQAVRDLRGSLIALQDALAPLVQSLAPFVQGLAALARQRPDLVRTVAAVAAGLLAVGAALYAVSLVAPLVTAAIAAGGAALAAAPYLLAAAAIGAIVVSLGLAAREAGLFQGAFGKLGGVFTGIKTLALDLAATIVTAFGGIMDALKAGDLELAGQIGMKGLEVIWKRTVLALTEAWAEFKGVVVDGWHELASGAVIAFRGIGPLLEKFFLQLWERVKNSFFDLLREIVSAAQAMVRQLPRGDRLAAELDPIKGALDAKQIELTTGNQELQRRADERLAAMFKEEQDNLNGILDKNAEFRATQIQAAREDFQRAADELAALRALAANAAAAANRDGVRGLLPSLVEIPRKRDIFAQARGGFASSASANQFGMGDKGQSMLVELRKIGRLAENWVAATANLNIIAENSKKFGIVVGQ